MSPFGATTRWRPAPRPSCTTVAVKPAGSVRPSLSAAVATQAAAPKTAAIDRLTTRANLVVRMYGSSRECVAARGRAARRRAPPAPAAAGGPVRTAIVLVIARQCNADAPDGLFRGSGPLGERLRHISARRIR